MPTSCVRFMTEGCAVASVLGMLEERESAARVRVEGLREEVARLAEVLEAAEIELDRRVIAREELSDTHTPNNVTTPSGVLSYRVAIPRQFRSRLMHRSTVLRSL